MQQLTSLFANVLSHPKELRTESKEIFFATKRNHKRLKVSTCFSEPVEKQSHQPDCLDFSLASIKTENPFHGYCKELQSTFGEDNGMNFKRKQPKRKQNINRKMFSKNKPAEQSESDAESQHSYSILEKEKLEFRMPNLQFQKKITKENTLSISNFQLTSKIGEGTYSEVFKAIDKATGFICAIKILQKWKMRELNVEENVIRQIKINSFLDHPNIAKLYSFFDDQNYIYLICQYATDKNLFESIREPRLRVQKGINDKTATSIISQICEAIGFIHKNFVIHRDIKPQNILLTLNNTIKICDFGWSVYNPSKQLRMTLCGTPLYLAPQLVAQASYDDSVDIWAIGVITYELLADKSPFKITQLKDLKKILYQQIKFDCIRNKKAIDFIQKAMEKDYCKRISIFELCTHPFLESTPQYNQN